MSEVGYIIHLKLSITHDAGTDARPFPLTSTDVEEGALENSQNICSMSSTQLNFGTITGSTMTLLFAFSSSLIRDCYSQSTIQPFTADFPRADIHEMLSPDLLHQLIKGTFKDHLVEWVGQYLVYVHGEARANKILDDIDRR